MGLYRILLLDDDEFVLASLRRELLSEPYVGHEGLEIEGFTSPLAALERARDKEGYFDVVITDNRMREMSGIDFLRAFADIQPDTVRIMLSGHSDREELARAINVAHIDFFVAKPVREYDLRCALVQALRHYDVRCENRRLAKLYLERFGFHHRPEHKDRYDLMVVDDEPSVLAALRRELGGAPFQGFFGVYTLDVHTFEHADQAMSAAQKGKFDVVISDYAMPVLNGIEFLRMIKETQPYAVRMLISGAADVDVLIAAVNTAGVSYFVGKPWHDYELRAAIDRALAHRELELENRLLADLLRLRSKP